MRRLLAVAVLPLTLTACGGGSEVPRPGAEAWLALACGIHEESRNAPPADRSSPAYHLRAAAGTLFTATGYLEDDQTLAGDGRTFKLLAGFVNEAESRENFLIGIDEVCTDVDARDPEPQAISDYICALTTAHPDAEAAARTRTTAAPEWELRAAWHLALATADEDLREVASDAATTYADYAYDEVNDIIAELNERTC